MMVGDGIVFGVVWCEDIVGFVGVSVGGEGWEWGVGIGSGSGSANGLVGMCTCVVWMRMVVDGE